MHPLAATSYPRRVTLTPTRSSRRRARRAAIAVVAGLLGAGTGQAYAGPAQHDVHPHLPGSHAMVHRHADWGSVDPPRPFDQHTQVTGGRTVPLDSPSDGGSVDAWPGVLLVTAAGVLGAVTLARRHRVPTST